MKLLFMGRKRSAAEALRWTLGQGVDVVAVVTDHEVATSPTAKVAREHDKPLLSLEDVTVGIERGDLDFELAVSFVYWRVLKEPVLSFPKYGIINFHPAPLPDFKGTAGYNLAILEALDSWAVTAHYIDKGVDTGPIIERFEFSIDPEEETAVTIERKRQAFMVSLYKKVLRKALRHGLLPTVPNEGGRYISRKAMEAMKRVEPGDDVDRKIRAFWFPPYTGAYVVIDGKKYTLVNEAILQGLPQA